MNDELFTMLVPGIIIHYSVICYDNLHSVSTVKHESSSYKRYRIVLLEHAITGLCQG